MVHKTPSSLDYEALLHELALMSWRRGLLDRDFSKARVNAGRLTRSSERMWKWIGHSNLAVTELCCGLRDAALSAFEDAERCYADIPGLAAASRESAAYVLLESGEPARALEKSASGSLWHGVALARLGYSEEATSIARGLAAQCEPLATYLNWELGMGSSASLSRAVRSLIERGAALHQPLVPIQFALARTLEAEGHSDEAIGVYETIVATSEGLLYWPVPYVRSHFRRGRICSDAGGAERAREANRLFLAFWENGELDRDEVAEARQRVSS